MAWRLQYSDCARYTVRLRFRQKKSKKTCMRSVSVPGPIERLCYRDRLAPDDPYFCQSFARALAIASSMASPRLPGRRDGALPGRPAVAMGWRPLDLDDLSDPDYSTDERRPG